MKLWQKSITVEQQVDQFTVGHDRVLDLKIAPFDVQASKAHVAMLGKIGLLKNGEAALLLVALDEIGHQIESGQFVIESEFEDVHSKIEFLLTEKLGDLGKKVHAGRSRNDQVLVALHLFFKSEIKSIVGLKKQLALQLIDLAEQHQEVLMPGYTHTQIAMVSSFGMWLAAFAEALINDLDFWEAAYKSVNMNPLGSGAGYGSSLPLDRKATTEALGFGQLAYGSIFAQLCRGRSEARLSWAMSSSAQTLNKLASDVVLFMSQNFDFIRFPDELTTGSSIMPHKKNPDVFELIRGYCGQILALPQQLILLGHNLTTGYHRDFQLFKNPLFPALDQLKQCLAMSQFMFESIEVHPAILSDPKYRYAFSVEAVNALVLNGVPFREAYRRIGEQIESGNFEPTLGAHTHEGSLGRLGLEVLRKRVSLAFSQEG
ncbi:MAG: argininosuccinate lyase [Bacteroidota bacterium]